MADELIWAIISIAGLSSTIMVAVLWAVKNFLRTKSGKIIDSAKAQHKPLVLAASLDHHAKLTKVSSWIPGVLESVKFRSRVGKNRKVFFAPKRTEVKLTEDDISDEKSRELTQECLDVMLKLNTEKVFLEDGVPVTLALEDKVITTGVKGIGALAFYEKLTKIDGIKDQIQKLKGDTNFKVVGEYLESLASGVSPINIEVLRNYFDSDWDQSDEESQKEYHYMQGYRDGQKKEKGIEKALIYGCIGIALAGIVGGAVFGYLKI